MDRFGFVAVRNLYKEVQCPSKTANRIAHYIDAEDGKAFSSMQLVNFAGLFCLQQNAVAAPRARVCEALAENCVIRVT